MQPSDIEIGSTWRSKTASKRVITIVTQGQGSSGAFVLVEPVSTADRILKRDLLRDWEPVDADG